MQIRAKGNETGTRVLPDLRIFPRPSSPPHSPLCSPILDSHQPAFCHCRCFHFLKKFYAQNHIVGTHFFALAFISIVETLSIPLCVSTVLSFSLLAVFHSVPMMHRIGSDGDDIWAVSSGAPWCLASVGTCTSISWGHMSRRRMAGSRGRCGPNCFPKWLISHPPAAVRRCSILPPSPIPDVVFLIGDIRNEWFLITALISHSLMPSEGKSKLTL